MEVKKGNIQFLYIVCVMVCHGCRSEVKENNTKATLKFENKKKKQNETETNLWKGSSGLILLLLLLLWNRNKTKAYRNHMKSSLLPGK